MGCCGSGNRQGRSPKTPLPQLAVKADRLAYIYTGNRKGSFGFQGPVTRAKYEVNGPGELITTVDGVAGIDPRDEQGVKAMQVFRKVQPPRPKPVQHVKLEPVVKQSFDPDLGAVSNPVPDPVTPALIPDPGDYTISKLKSLDLTPDASYVMLNMEREGQNRGDAIKHLKKIAESKQ